MTSTFYAFDIEKQEMRWEFETGGIIRSGADITGATVVFASDDGLLYALSADLGAELWRFDLGSSGMTRVLPATDPPYEYDYLHSSPIYHEGTIYVGSANGVLYALDHETGRERWRFATDGKIRSTPVVDGRNVYFGSWDGHVYAVDARDGTEVWRFDTGGIVQGSPTFGSRQDLRGQPQRRRVRARCSHGRAEVEARSRGRIVGLSHLQCSDDGAVYVGSSDAR